MRKKYFTKEALAEAKRISARKYYQNNRDKVLAYDKEWRNSEEGRKATLNYQRLYRKTLKGYAGRFVERARKYTPDTDVDMDFIVSLLEQGTCALTGQPFEFTRKWKQYSTNPRGPSLDRIDSSRGYYKDNSQFILVWLNRAKNEYSSADFRVLMEEANSLKWSALTDA